jgi:hypothetical protein
MFQHETEQEKAERKERVEDAACTLQVNAVDTAKEVHPNWREMSEVDWMNAVYDQKVSQLRFIADQYRVEPDELKEALGLM